MTAALAIVFLLNGAQVDLPVPALIVNNAAYVPARAVLEQLGWKVEWDAAAQKLNASVEEVCTYSFTVGSPQMTLECSVCATTPAGTQETLDAPPLIIGDYLYLPVRAVAIMAAGRTEWNGPTMTVNLITEAQGNPQDAETGSIIADPAAWVRKLVRLQGEYTGWQADPFGPAVSHGPPVTRSDWTIRDLSGSLYCTRPTSVQEFAVKLDPQADLGRRLEVLGTVALTADGWPYLQISDISPLEGLAGLTCYLTTDRHTYQPGEVAKLQMKVFNPTEEAQILQFRTSQQFDFSARNPDGETVWKWSQGLMFAQMLTQKALQPGEGYSVTADWTLPADLPPALYRVSGELNREVSSYVKTVSVTKE